MLKNRRQRAILNLLLLAPPFFFTVLGVMLVVWGGRDRAQKAEAIIVFGARVNASGDASPILRARTRRAFELWKHKLAPRIVCTGGIGTYPPAEAIASARLLRSWGVPQSAILVDDKSTSTRENAINAAALLPRGARVIAVSEAFHLWRCRRDCAKLGLVVFTSPENAGWQQLDFKNQAFYALREAVLVTRDVIFSRF